MRVLFCLFMFVLIGCGPTISFDENIEVGEDWSYDEVMQFDIDIIDSTQHYDLNFILSHGIDFPYQNLYVLISTTYPNGKVVEDVVSLQIADKMGEFSGRCSGEKCKTTIVLQENFRFHDLGKHTISIAQNSRQESLRDIFAGRLKLIETPKK